MPNILDLKEKQNNSIKINQVDCIYIGINLKWIHWFTFVKKNIQQKKHKQIINDKNQSFIPVPADI